MSYSREIHIAQLAVKRASLLTHRVSTTHLSAITKDDKSPVTIGDFGAQAIIINAIKKNFPNDQVVGEEDSNTLRQDKQLSDKILSLIKEIEKEDSKHDDDLGVLEGNDAVLNAIDHGDSKGGRVGRIWALDPIDGTKGFLRGDQYAVCLALIEDGEVKVGVIGCPNLLEDLDDSSSYRGGLFSAYVGGGSYYQRLWDSVLPLNEQERIQMNNEIGFDKAIVCEGVEKGHSSHSTQSQIKDILKIQSKSTNLDSQVKYCALAKGMAEIYLRLPISDEYREKIWDHAAGNILITESKGVVSDILGNTLDFGFGRTLNSKGVIAASSKLHRGVIEAVNKVLG